MENKLQELTKKLYDEGLEKGRAEADRLVGEAKNEAAKIVAEARAQAEEIVKKARDKAEDVEKNTMTEIALAGKQAAAKIKSEIASMIVAKATAAGVKEAALDPAFIKEMLLAVAGNWNGADAGKVELKALLPEAERTTIAYHESGHALVGHILEHSDPVHKISIVSRGQALGYTLQLPQEDHFLKTKNEMLDELAVFLGGRVAEELMCDDITSGASNDLERATKMAREMVTRLGMSEELGTQVFGEAQHQVFLGRDYADHQDYSEETARRIDIEVQRIMREAHRRAVEILDARRDQLDLMAKVLLERETVEGDAVNALLDNEWNAYLEREGDILAAKEERNAKAAGMPTKKRAPRMSEEELAADAAAFAQAAMQEDAEAASDDADDDHVGVGADADTDADK